MSRMVQRFTVQDVIDAVQNGESDVDIDSDGETDSDESDEEPCGELDKENIPSTNSSDDCPANADIEPRLATSVKPRAKPRDRYRWQKKDFTRPNTEFSGPPLTEDVTSLRTPLEYFRQFVSKDMIQALTTNTNEYHHQKKGTDLKMTKKEIEMMLGMYLKMGLVQMPGQRMYWETDTRHAPVADVMPRNRFQALLRSLHVVNNMTVSETEKNDKLWKLRPWLDSFREKCLQVVPEEHNSVDEMMIPFKGRFSSIKQYMRGKPHPWGFKVWVRTGISGMMCDFDVYQGSTNGIRAKSELGLSGDVVMKLASTLPEGQNYKIYADNFFTSVPLIEKLVERGIHYVGTARQGRIPNCNLEDDKSLKKKGRGTFDHRVEVNHNISAVKWFDNRPVTLLSSFAATEPVQTIRRWDKANKTYIDVQRPYIVGNYNQYMGGVDLLDSLTANYKYPLKSRRWYMYIFWHTITLAVVNAWLLYKRDCQALKEKPELTLRRFQGRLASSLILVDSVEPAPKRGRPSSGKSPVTSSPVPVKRPCSDATSTPLKRACGNLSLDVRHDQIGHFPKKTTRGRCRHCPNGYTTTQCRKCDVRLCFSETKNCFSDFHE